MGTIFLYTGTVHNNNVIKALKLFQKSSTIDNFLFEQIRFIHAELTGIKICRCVKCPFNKSKLLNKASTTIGKLSNDIHVQYPP